MIEVRNETNIPLRIQLVKVKSTGRLFLYVKNVKDNVVMPNDYLTPEIEESEW